MKKIFIYTILILFIFHLTACNVDLPCERHFLPKGFIGEVKIYFNQKNGQKKIDKNGCLIYQISETGKCYSALPYKEGIARPNATLRYFESINDTTFEVVPEFESTEFYKDSLTNRKKKYIYFILSGYENYKYVFEYYVDYGSNHKKYSNW
jgi:hypothetical protein